MKRTILALLVAGMFSGIAMPSIAQNVTAGDQPPAKTQAAPDRDSTAGKSSANAAAKVHYNEATEKAEEQFKDAMTKCESLKGLDVMKNCVTNAHAARSEALALATTQWKGELNGTLSNADYDYSEAKEKAEEQFKDSMVKCQSLKGVDAMKSCVGTANKVRTDALALANSEWQAERKGTLSSADYDYSQARAKAAADFDEAKVKCDSLKGTEEVNNCMKNAKAARTDALAQARTQWESRGGIDGAGRARDRRVDATN